MHTKVKKTVGPKNRAAPNAFHTSISSNSFQTIFSQSPISTQIFSPDGLSIAANAAWEKLWGIKHSDLGGMYNVTKDPQLKAHKIDHLVRRAFRGHIVEIPAIRYDPSQTKVIPGQREYRWVKALMYPVFDSSKGVANIILQHEDITDEKDALDKLEQSRAHLKAMWDVAGIAMALSDRSGIVLEANSAYLQLYGFEKNEVIGKSFTVIFAPEKRDAAMEGYAHAFSDKKASAVLEATVVSRTGVERVVEARYSFITERGKRTAMLSIINDITERRTLELQKDEFIGVASHELKTPVTSIKAYGQVLQTIFNRKGDTRSTDLLKKMDAQVNKLTNLIGDLLDVTKIQSGNLMFHTEQFDFNTFVEEMVNEMQMTTEKHMLILKMAPSTLIVGDKERLGQVITNLLSNAIKYSPHTEEILIKTTKHHDRVTLSVQDFGIGISEDKRSRVFERFYRVSGNTERTFPGLGLGLYISSEILKRQGGTISVTSSEGKGSTFTFSLPITRPAEKRTSAIAEEEMKHD